MAKARFVQHRGRDIQAIDMTEAAPGELVADQPGAAPEIQNFYVFIGAVRGERVHRDARRDVAIVVLQVPLVGRRPILIDVKRIVRTAVQRL